MPKRRSKKQPPPPEFLVDRSLGRYSIPEAVEGRGFVAHTLFSVYGTREQELDDVEWLRDAGTNGWAVLTKDPNIRRRAEEVAAVERMAVVMFALPRGNLTGAEQVARYMDNWNRIVQACRKPGPRIYSVHPNRLELMYPRGSR